MRKKMTRTSLKALLEKSLPERFLQIILKLLLFEYV